MEDPLDGLSKLCCSSCGHVVAGAFTLPDSPMPYLVHYLLRTTGRGLSKAETGYTQNAIRDTEANMALIGDEMSTVLAELQQI